jgi:hypothetical protein
VDGDNVFALYIRTKESEASLNQFIGAVGIERMDDDMNRAGKSQLDEARTLIENGKKPVEVVSIAGISLATAYKLEKEFKAKHSLNIIPTLAMVPPQQRGQSAQCDNLPDDERRGNRRLWCA